MQKPLSEHTTIDGGVATPLPHDSATKHVTGSAIYVDDIATPPGTLEIYIAMSTHAHARVTALDVTKVRTAPGVVAVLTARPSVGHSASTTPLANTCCA